MGYQLPGSSVHRILQARILEGVVMPSSRGYSQPRDQTQEFCVSCTAGGFLLLSHQGSPHSDFRAQERKTCLLFPLPFATKWWDWMHISLIHDPYMSYRYLGIPQIFLQEHKIHSAIILLLFRLFVFFVFFFLLLTPQTQTYMKLVYNTFWNLLTGLLKSLRFISCY